MKCAGCGASDQILGGTGKCPECVAVDVHNYRALHDGRMKFRTYRPVIAMLNADMFGTPSETGEHVDWSEPDVMAESEWEDLLGCSVPEYAATSPHMIVWEA